MGLKALGEVSHTRWKCLCSGARALSPLCVSMILPQVHLRKPCYDFSFLEMFRFKQLQAVLFRRREPRHGRSPKISSEHSSVGATGGVYKGQGRIQCELMTRVYKAFLVA